jgi:RNA polymerase sigma-70 factor (ECF subfamily)
MEATADALLVTAARGGDAAAYGELFARYKSRIYNYAYGIAGNCHDAADIAQEAFVRVFEALPRLTGELNFSAYVYRVTHNIAIDMVRGRSRFDAPEALDMQLESSLRADPERVALVQEQQRQTWQAAFQLRDDFRSILTLRELHDLSYDEIAEIMDMPRNTVGVLLSRARLRFKEAFRMSSVDIDKLTKECQDMLPLLSAYIDDELDDVKRARVESHLEQCAFCRLALEEMTESSRSYRALLPLLPPAVLGEGVWQRLGDTVTSDQSAPSSSPTDVAGDAEETTSSSATELRPGGRHLHLNRHSHIKVLATLAGGAVVVALAVLVATGTLGGRGGSDDESTLAASIAGSSSSIAISTTTSTTSLEPSTSTVATVAVTTEPPTTVLAADAPTITVAPVVDTMAVSTTAIGTSSTTETTTTDTASEQTDPDLPSTTVTEVGDVDAPATPGIIYPAAGDVVKGSTVVLRWKPVKDPSGVTYKVEVQSLDRKAGAYVTTQLVDTIKETELKHSIVSSIERWRVTAIDGAGNESDPSAWAKYAQATLDTTTTTLFLPNLPDITIKPIVTTTSTTVILY